MQESTNQHDVLDLVNYHMALMTSEVDAKNKCRGCAFQHLAVMAVINYLVVKAQKDGSDGVTPNDAADAMNGLFAEVIAVLTKEGAAEVAQNADVIEQNRKKQH